MRWNLDKTYLRSLAERGVPIVPTAWRERLQRGKLATLFDEAGREEIVVKPLENPFERVPAAAAVRRQTYSMPPALGQSRTMQRRTVPPPR